MKKLRLLFTEDCNNNCESCCNKQYNLKKLPVCKSFEEYEEILITGGEPFLYPERLFELVSRIRKESNNPKIYIYTSLVNIKLLNFLLYSSINGITLTLHNQDDVNKFFHLNKIANRHKWFLTSKPLRLNIFDSLIFPEYILTNINYNQLWKIKYIKWIDNCPIPENEIFMRYEHI